MNALVRGAFQRCPTCGTTLVNLVSHYDKTAQSNPRECEEAHASSSTIDCLAVKHGLPAGPRTRANAQHTFVRHFWAREFMEYYHKMMGK